MDPVEPERPNPMSLAFEWVGRIMAVSLLMFLPGLAGQWLDRRLGTQFLTLLGFGIGFVAGFVSLLTMTRAMGKRKSGRSSASGDSRRPKGRTPVEDKDEG